MAARGGGLTERQRSSRYGRSDARGGTENLRLQIRRQAAEHPGVDPLQRDAVAGQEA